MRRRDVAATLGLGTWWASCSRQTPSPGHSAVAVVKASSYQENLADLIRRGVTECGAQVKGKKILLKPNLVEFDATRAVTTNVAVVAAALEVFQSLGAAEVRIGEGPGHRRDAFGVAEAAGYRAIEGFEKRFVDLNRDDVFPRQAFAGLDETFFAKSVLEADLIVSLAKLKTHHWAGATLAMKNLFGLVPGAVYGWPKNLLHQIGISRSIVELNRLFQNTFAIVDGIVGMEGNGPLHGADKPAGVLVMGSDMVAVDATCCRIMGIDPTRVEYLSRSTSLGNVDQTKIDQRGERPAQLRTDFALIPAFAELRLQEDRHGS
ncbi:MAG: DUF362 domain-containing protein [Bryobacteraceae bacterium]|nr:DUF362 domain-containing protein [Bryobacteraceae bacterium]